MGRAPGARNRPESRLRNGSIRVACKSCGTKFWVTRSQRKVKGGGKFCSRECRYAGSTAHKQRRTAQVTRHSAGYLLEFAPGHPRASHGRVLQHVLVAEAMLGRPLNSGEEVHHRNGRRDDNQPWNLEVLRKGEHQRRHWQDLAFREAASNRAKRNAKGRSRGADGRLLPG